MTLNKKTSLVITSTILIIFLYKYYGYVSSQGVWYDDAHELIISKISIFNFVDFARIADYHFGFSLILLLITNLIKLDLIYQVLVFIFLVAFGVTNFYLISKKYNPTYLIVAQVSILISSTFVEYSFRPKHYVYEFLIVLILSVLLNEEISLKKISVILLLSVLFSNLLLIYFIYPFYKYLKKDKNIKNFLFFILLIPILSNAIDKITFSKFKSYWKLENKSFMDAIENLYLNNLLLMRNYLDTGFLFIFILIVIIGLINLFLKDRDLFLFIIVPYVFLNLLNILNFYPIGGGRTDIIIFPFIFFSIYYFSELCFSKFNFNLIFVLSILLTMIFIPVLLNNKIDNTKLILDSVDFEQYDSIFISYYTVPQFVLWSENMSGASKNRGMSECFYHSKSEKIIFLQEYKNGSCHPLSNLGIIQREIKKNKKILILGYDSKTQNILNFVESDELLFKNLKITKIGKDELIIASLNK